MKFHSIVIYLKFHDHEFNCLKFTSLRGRLWEHCVCTRDEERENFVRGLNYPKISNKNLPCLEVGPSGCPRPAPGGGQSYPLRRQQTNSSRPFYPMQSCVVGGSNSVKRLGINRNSISIYLIFGNSSFREFLRLWIYLIIYWIQNNFFTSSYFIYCRPVCKSNFILNLFQVFMYRYTSIIYQ